MTATSNLLLAYMSLAHNPVVPVSKNHFSLKQSTKIQSGWWSASYGLLRVNYSVREIELLLFLPMTACHARGEDLLLDCCQCSKGGLNNEGCEMLDPNEAR
jgi:hypothetical protein